MNERVLKLLNETVAALETELAKETIKYDLTPEGDASRRAAAGKWAGVELLAQRFKTKLKKELL